MTIEIALLLSIISVSFGVWQAISAAKRDQSKDDREDASEMTTIAVDLKYIRQGVNEIKDEMKNMKKDIRDDHDLLIKVEESVKSAHKRIDEIAKQNNSHSEE